MASRLRRPVALSCRRRVPPANRRLRTPAFGTLQTKSRSAHRVVPYGRRKLVEWYRSLVWAICVLVGSSDRDRIALDDVSVCKAAVAQNRFSDRVLDTSTEARSARYKSMEFTALTTRVYPSGKVCKKGLIELSAGKRRIELLGIDANQTRLVSFRNEPMRKRRRIELP